MANTSIEVLLGRSEPEQHPIFSFQWVCDYLPFEHDATYVETLELPFCNVDQQQGWFGAGTFTYYPDFSNISSFGVTFYEDSRGSTSKWLYDWKNRIKVLYGDSGSAEQYGAYKLPKEYKRHMKFSLLDTTGEPVLTLTLMYVWPTETSALSMDYTQSERIKISQSFSCDDQKIEFPKGGGSNSASAGNSFESQLENSTWSNIGSAGGASLASLGKTMGKVFSSLG